MNALLKKLGWMFLLASLSAGGFAQSLDQAKKLYNEGQYEEAKPAFEKLVKQSPNNSSYNLWYGVCCYETGELEAAEKYLQVALNRKVAEASRYLAHIYFSSYRFDKAVPMWEEYIALLEKKKEDTEEYEALLEKTEKMLRMKEKTEDIQVIDSMVVSKDRILSVYHLSEDCGVLRMYNDFFKSSQETQPSTVYINPKNDQAYYARPDETGRYSLYTQSRLMDAWADEKALFASETDNNYPFVLGDGMTLYFASKGNGSIGGYDLFVTRYNTGSNSFLAPEQLGMPFNSTANDYLMVIDEVKKLGWFVSDRNQPEGQVCVYLFIPDESRKRIAESEDEDWLRGRATLASIKDTWVEGGNYSAQIRLAQTDDTSKEKTVKRDFEFVINDHTTYYTWNEFRSAEAKMSYEKVIGLKKQMQTLEDKLDEARTAYAKGNSSAHEQLKPSILQAEEKLSELLSQIDEWEKKTRNTENLKLKN
jgi:tetratricopeptide (TPR) repeat protein